MRPDSRRKAPEILDVSVCAGFLGPRGDRPAGHAPNRHAA